MVSLTRDEQQGPKDKKADDFPDKVKSHSFSVSNLIQDGKGIAFL